MQDQIVDLALELTQVTKAKIADLDHIMLHTQILAMNARLEAARAGEAGKSFAIVAQEMGTVSQQVTALAASLNYGDYRKCRSHSGSGTGYVDRFPRQSVCRHGAQCSRDY